MANHSGVAFSLLFSISSSFQCCLVYLKPQVTMTNIAPPINYQNKGETIKTREKLSKQGRNYQNKGETIKTREKLSKQGRNYQNKGGTMKSVCVKAVSATINRLLL